MELLDRFLERNRQEEKISIHCVGDAMIDEYIDIEINRISPEYPVPVMRSTHATEVVERPGGVANVAYQFRHFNADAQLVCFSDFHATKVFRESRLKYTPCTTQQTLLPRKRRFLQHHVQSTRHDIESPKYALNDADYLVALQESLEITEDLPQPDVAILSDYDKGFLPSSQRRAWLDRYKNTITIVDPKNGKLEDWKGCTIFKPNHHEAKAFSDLSDWKEQCDFFASKLGCHAVVITCGGNGVVGWDGENYFEYNPRKQILPESLVGAGDCFVAFLAMAIARKFSVQESAQIAYEAGAVYVQNKMNRPIIPAELCLSRMIYPEDLLHRDFKLVFTNGCFDILHRGHLQTLKFAKSKGDKLVVALNSDASVRRLKGETRPIKMLDERMAMMSELKDVDFVTFFDEDTPAKIIEKCMPDVLVKGGDYKTEDIVGANKVKEVYVAPLVDGVSTTKILDQKK